MEETEYLESLKNQIIEGLTPQRRRAMTLARIQHIEKVKQKKCPNSPDPAMCKQKYNEKIAVLKGRLKKLSGKILGVVPQTQKFVKKAEGYGND